MTRGNRQSDRSENERSLYVHVPFCRHRCGYCNFSLVAGRDYLVDRYLLAIEREVARVAEQTQDVSTVFLGGGTPSHLEPRQLTRLVDTLRQRFHWDETAEFSIECNPEDMNDAKRDAFKEVGINRISFGLQSLRDSKLKLLERSHNAGEISSALQLARSVTENISFDLIFAVPGESWDQWQDDLRQSVALNPSHLSTYELTIEKGTQFWNRHHRSQFSIADEEHRLQLYLLTIEFLESAGYQQYEISSFARAEKRCRHNQNYWNGNDYFAIGPGAASYVNSIRRTNHRSTSTWLKMLENNQSPVTDVETLDFRQQAMDMLIFGLRQIDGIRFDRILNKTGFDMRSFGRKTLEKHLHLELADLNGDRLRLTRKGITLYDSIAQDWANLV